MHKKLPRLSANLALAFALAAPLAGTLRVCTANAAPAGAVSAAGNEAATKRYFASLVAGDTPKQAELTMFFSMMPKGGDLHHHYWGAIYAEQLLEWVDKQHYCVNKATFRIETEKATVNAEQAKPIAERSCLSGADVSGDETVLSGVLQRWSDKDFYNHGAVQPPPDRQFFDTFGYFAPVASSNTNEGLLLLKKRAIQENLSYIETMFELAPFVQNVDFDRQVLQPNASPASLTAQMTALADTLAQDKAFAQSISDYLSHVNASSTDVDDDQFTMRYQAYALRLLSPSQVFSSLLSAFKIASQSKLVVGVNIVGQESVKVSMRDYELHMQMFKFLKTKYPSVKLALHAGELALGTVPPEGLTFHIRDALEVGGANRIGHGIDLAHETNPLAILKTMRERDIPVEVNLSSNAFILGIKDQAHPVTLYRKYGVPFVLSTDDPGVSRNNLSGEYVLFASRYKTDYAEVKRLSYNSLKYSFLAEGDKQRLLKALDSKFAIFEAAIASSTQKALTTKQ